MRTPSSVRGKQEMRENDDARKDQKRDRDAQDGFIGHQDHGVRESGNGAPAREVDCEPMQQGHGSQRHKDRVHAEDSDQQTRNHADHDGEQQAGGECAGEPCHKLQATGVRRHDAGQDPGHQQACQIGCRDDGEIDAAGDQGDGHRERQQPEFGDLEHHRLDGCRPGKCRRHQEREDRDENREQQQKADNIAGSLAQRRDQAIEPGRQPVGVIDILCAAPHQFALGLCHLLACFSANPVMLIEIRIARPMTTPKK